MNEVSSLPADDVSKEQKSGGFLPTASKSSMLLALVGVIAAAVILVIPVPQGRHHRIISAFLDLGHVPLFAALTWGAMLLFGRRVWVLAALIILVVGGEYIQYFAPSRMPDRKDMMHGLVGVGIAWLTSWGWNRSSYRWATAAGTLALLAIPIVNLLPDVLDVVSGMREFPVLCDFQSPWQDRRWDTHQGNVRTLRDEGGNRIGRIDFFAGHRDDYPGVEFIPVNVDWTGFRVLSIDFTAENAIELCLTVRDQRPDPSHHERFNYSRHFEPGRHRIEIELDDIRDSPRDGPVDLARIDSINFFIAVAGAPNHVWIHEIALEE